MQMYLNSRSHKLLRGYKPPATIQANFSGLKEVGWGASFLEASIVIESVLVFKNQESAAKAFGYCQNSSDILKLALSQEGKRQAALFLINQLHARHEGNQIKATLEVNSTDMEELIPLGLSYFIPRFLCRLKADRFRQILVTLHWIFRFNQRRKCLILKHT